MKLVREIASEKLKNKGKLTKKFYVLRKNSYYKTQIWNKKTIRKDPKTNLERK